MSTLELLPMWGGAEPDVDLFFSGEIIEDDGEWAGGQSLQNFDAGEMPKHTGTYAALMCKTRK